VFLLKDFRYSEFLFFDENAGNHSFSRYQQEKQEKNKNFL